MAGPVPMHLPYFVVAMSCYSPTPVWPPCVIYITCSQRASKSDHVGFALVKPDRMVLDELLVVKVPRASQVEEARSVTTVKIERRSYLGG
jgi:hypothetical protein